MKDVILRICMSASLAAAQQTQPATTPPSTHPPRHPTSADATTGKGAVAPTAPQQTVLREGTYLVDRTGRLQRSPEGTQMEFHFDADGKTLRDPPVVIIPSLTLMAMENAVSGSSRDLRFRI